MDAQLFAAHQLTPATHARAPVVTPTNMRPGNRVGGRGGEQHVRGIDEQGAEEEHDQQHHPEGHALVLPFALEAGVADARTIISAQAMVSETPT
jgi:hypothetical protein